MVVEIDLHVLSRLAYNVKEMSDLFSKGPSEFHQLKGKFVEHRQQVLNLVELVEVKKSQRKRR